MKKIILSLSVIAAVAAVVVGATTAFFSDTETSTGNTFTAGAIDLKIDNSAWYNGNAVDGSTWGPKDLEEGNFFFNLSDLKPGDWEEDTISLHVDNNNAWACVDVTLTQDDEVTLKEPEEDLGDVADTSDLFDGELAQELQFIWWADDGDNVLEEDENVINSGNLGWAPEGQTVNVTLADKNNNIWTRISGDPLEGEQPYYIGKAFCLGELDEENNTYSPWIDGDENNVEDNSGPGSRRVACDGKDVSNWSQSDSVMMDISFRAEQSRNNPDFSCQAQENAS